MPKVRVTLISGRIVDGKITKNENIKPGGKPVLVVDGVPYTILDAAIKGMSVYPVNDPLFDQWQKTYG
jgi:hypothetical protein